MDYFVEKAAAALDAATAARAVAAEKLKAAEAAFDAAMVAWEKAQSAVIAAACDLELAEEMAGEGWKNNPA